MSDSILKKSLLLLCALLLLVTAGPVNAHVMTTGVSRWCFGKDYVLVQIDLDSYLMGFIKGIKEGRYNPDTIDEKLFPKIAAEVIQPYINDRLHLTINSKPCALKVTRLTKSGDNLFTIWLYADKATLNRPDNPVKIDYRLLFTETSYAHQNLTFIYTADGSVDAVQKIFDFSPPKWQAIFDPSAPEWEVSITR
ncbi:MAG TPA: hypothetical protein VMJ66_17620 [Geobacteraceae bacterium]|nr:hypothetical protein [Geobacteraceae bacterium]